MSFQYIFSQNYLFDPVPTPESKLYIPLLIVFSAMIILSLLPTLLKSLDKRIRIRNFYTFLVSGVLGLVYLFCRYEQLPWLGSRFALAVIVSAFIVWSIVNFIWMLRYIPKQKHQKILKERYEKYLPKKKSKRE